MAMTFATAVDRLEGCQRVAEAFLRMNVRPTPGMCEGYGRALLVAFRAGLSEGVDRGRLASTLLPFASTADRIAFAARTGMVPPTTES